MKDNLTLILNLLSPLLLILGDLGLFFQQTMFLGFVLFSLGIVLGLVNIARGNFFDAVERFHLLTLIAALLMLVLFIFVGVIDRLVILAIILFIVDFTLFSLDISRRGESKKVTEYNEYNEEKLYKELENIQDELNHVKILDEGDIEDLSLKAQAEQIRKDLTNVVVFQEPKEDKYYYTDKGKMFHIAGCISMQRSRKKDINSSNSRTELLAKGYKSCKVCNS